MRPTVLVTGISGVVGSALPPLLDRYFNVIALTGTRPGPSGMPSRRIDLTCDDLGLDRTVMTDLAARADVVIHVAGNVSYTADPAELSAINEAGTARMVRFAEAARCPLLYVSSAYTTRVAQAVTREHLTPGGSTSRPTRYLESKIAADARVGRCDQEWSIIRPSVVMGRSRDGVTPQTQYLHSILSTLVDPGLPVVFMGPRQRADTVPRDALAAAIVSLARAAVEGLPLPRQYWATSAEAAPTCQALLDLVGTAARERGLDFTPPVLLDPYESTAEDYPEWNSLDGATRRLLGHMFGFSLPMATGESFATSFGTEALPDQPAAITPADGLRHLAQDIEFALRRNLCGATA